MAVSLIVLGAVLLFAPVVAVVHVYAAGELPTLVVRRGGWHWFRETEPPWTWNAFKSWLGYYLLAGSGFLFWLYAVALAGILKKWVSDAIVMGATKAYANSLGALLVFLILQTLLPW
jgi:hypothetical protein